MIFFLLQIINYISGIIIYLRGDFINSDFKFVGISWAENDLGKVLPKLPCMSTLNLSHS
jgi:hypothetical protein